MSDFDQTSKTDRI